MTSTTLAARLAATAAGTWGEEAAIWLLDQHGHWLPELDRLDLIRDVPAAGWTATVICWAQFNAEPHRPVGTGSEMQVLNIAYALAWSSGAAPFRNLTSLDEQNKRLVLHAVAWAAGGQTWADSLNLLGSTDDYVSDREPCGESGCLCYGVGPDHAECACGCDCPRDDYGQLIDEG